MNRLKGLAKSTIVPSSAKAADPFAAALRVGQAAVQAESAAKKKEDGEGGSKQRLKELSAFVESRLQERGATLVGLWREASQSSEPRVREEFEYSLSSSFKGASVEVLERLQDFADMSAEELRKAVKQATIDSQMKLEQTRIASNLNVRNARVELETAFNTKLQEKISELQSNDGQEKLLQEAMEREAVLKSMFELQKERAVKAEQREKVLKDELAKAASAAAAAEKAPARQTPSQRPRRRRRRRRLPRWRRSTRSRRSRRWRRPRICVPRPTPCAPSSTRCASASMHVLTTAPRLPHRCAPSSTRRSRAWAPRRPRRSHSLSVRPPRRRRRDSSAPR